MRQRCSGLILGPRLAYSRTGFGPIDWVTVTRPNPTPLSIKAELVDESGRRIQGILHELERRGCVVELVGDGPADLALRSPVHIELPSVDGARIRGRLGQRVGRRLTVHIPQSEHEQRYYPRVDGGIDAEYRVLPDHAGDATRRSWLRGLSVADESPWFRPPPFMNFSVSGLRCEDGLGCKVGAELLFALRVPTMPNVVRATARVVRVDERPDAPNLIAVEFMDVDPNGVEALTDYTLDRQLEAFSDR